MPDSLPQPTRSGPLERIVRPQTDGAAVRDEQYTERQMQESKGLLW